MNNRKKVTRDVPQRLIRARIHSLFALLPSAGPQEYDGAIGA